MYVDMRKIYVSDPHYETWLQIKHLREADNADTVLNHQPPYDNTTNTLCITQPSDLTLISIMNA